MYWPMHFLLLTFSMMIAQIFVQEIFREQGAFKDYLLGPKQNQVTVGIELGSRTYLQFIK